MKEFVIYKHIVSTVD